MTFGSDLRVPADAVPFQHGWDQNVWNVQAPPEAMIRAPRPGLVRAIRVRGSALGLPFQVGFRVIRRAAAGTWTPVATPVTVPGAGSMNAILPTVDAIHTFSGWDPRAFRVEKGDHIAIYNYGGGGAGHRWRIFARRAGWAVKKVAVNDGFKDGAVEGEREIDRPGESVLTYGSLELLLQAVLQPDRCPGTDLPQLPCQSKLYLGGKVRKDRTLLRYVWTVRNGGPHKATNLATRVYLPAGTEVVDGTLPRSCEVQADPLSMLCHLSDLAAPQDARGAAIAQLAFTVRPGKVSRFFRASGTIEAPDVVDPQGTARHSKTVSVSTR